MLMPPQSNSSSSVPSPNPDYNFIFSDQKPKRRFGFKLPGSNNLAKITILIVAGGAVLGVIIIALSSILGPKINTTQLVDTVARAQEISRVSDAVILQSRDINTTNLAATTSNSLTSQEKQLLNYLAVNKKRVQPKDIKSYLNKTTDAEIVDAQQNNRLSEYYNSYLKKNLVAYQGAIQNAYSTAEGQNIKSTLNSFSISNTTILKAPQIATAQ
jgi:hypothetical protein